ncbi:MAG: hypothetical protein K2O18_04225 [Oscillospiraceae bacterium]|nr:hypothetical protein [Oscillospiraceae bacterium]
MNRSLPGTRLQGSRHGQSRAVPVTRPQRPSTARRAGNPEYPVKDIYAEKQSKEKQ